MPTNEPSTSTKNSILVTPERATTSTSAPSADLMSFSATTAFSETHSANQPRINTMLERDNITIAEIIWALHIVHKHESIRSGAEAVLLFEKMFPDLKIAKRMKLQRTKITYVINFGLANYFFGEL